jgi:exonuclease III
MIPGFSQISMALVNLRKKAEFIDCFRNIDMRDGTKWIVLGDFNFIRKPSGRNKPGGDINDMLLFNDAISRLVLLELPLKGTKYTWSNMQIDPLLERLDWFFTSNSWTDSFPSTFVYSMARPISDHVPCTVVISSDIPKARVFRFENY